MSVNTGPAGRSGGPICHGVVHRVPAGAGPLPGPVHLPGGDLPRPWSEPVAGPSGSALAARRRALELSTPVAVSSRSPLRTVLLEYTDGVTDLVVVADADRVHPDELDRTAADVLGAGGARPGPGKDRVPSATPTSPTVLPRLPHEHTTLPCGRSELRFSTRSLKPGEDAARDLAAALQLVLARTGAEGTAVLDVTWPGGQATGTVAAPDEDGSAADHRLTAFHRLVPQDAAEPGPEQRFALVVDAREPARTQLEHRPAHRGRHTLTLYAESDGDGGLALRAMYRQDALPHWRARSLVAHLVHVVDALTDEDPQRTAGDVELLDAEERRRVLALGRTPAPAAPRTRDLPPAPAPRTIHELVLSRAAADAGRTALCDGDRRLGYGELVECAARFAHALRGLDVAPGDRVGVCLERSADLVAVLLGVLMAGATYVPLDPAYPPERLAFTTRDAGLGLVLVDGEGRGASPDVFGPGVAVSLGRLCELAEHASPLPPESGVGPDDPAYVIYTSGSTGRPKGVEVPHRNVAALLAATTDDFGLGPEDSWTWFHSAAFDFSVWEIWGALITGGRLVVVPYWTCRSPEDFRQLLRRERVTVLNQTPSAFSRLLELERADDPLTDLRLVVFGGEPLDARGLIPWFDIHPESRCRVVNMFGITETTVHVTAHTVTRADALAGTRSVGRALPGWSVRVLDSRGRVLPPGAEGEIAVAGAGLALRYLHRPDLTAQRFVTDPYDGTRLYLSGDKGRMLPGGSLEHLGRLDSQVKLRGYRIELDEIRHVLLEHPDVSAAAVVLHHPEGRADDARLDAYVALDARGGSQGGGEGGGDACNAVRRHAAERLPEHMVPATVTALPELPLTLNGKVDVARLPAPVPPGSRVGAPSAPSAADGEGTLRAVLDAWREVLGVDCAADDDFFDVGGNSLLALRIVHSLRDRGIPAAVRDVYGLRTPALLAGHVDQQAATAAPD